MKKDVLYSITCLAFAIIIGGAVYEHMNVVPQWAAGPPASLSMFQGPYGLKPELFWMLIHPINLLLFLVSLVFHWKSARKKNIVTVLACYVAILILTATFFVPELTSIITASYSSNPDADLTRRASTWEILSLIRLGIMLILAIILFVGLTKTTARANYARS